MIAISEIYPAPCSFGWEKIKEMKKGKVEFWAGDGLNRLRIVEASDKERTLYRVIRREGKPGH